MLRLQHGIEVSKAYAEARASSIRVECMLLQVNTELKHGIEVTKAYAEASLSIRFSYFYAML